MNPVMWLDDIGKPAWIALMIVSFVLFWPAGLVVLGFLIGSGRMGCWTANRGERWQRRMERMQQRMQERTASWCGPGWMNQRSGSRAAGTSGNRAFDEYREETLRRLEEEERQFKEFLDRLRQAKDKAEFDQFMAEMRRRSEGPAPQPQA
ncbi:MAG: DUF2852 domain-containing protein [Thiohalocapsa sp.]